MHATRTDKIIVSLGALFGSYVCYVLVMMNDPAVLPWNIAYGAFFVAVWVSVWGLLRLKKWAYFLSLALAAAGLGLGVYLVHFAWTFWLFKEPTFSERILSAIHPRISVFAAVPVIWLVYFLNYRVRQRVFA